VTPKVLKFMLIPLKGATRYLIAAVIELGLKRVDTAELGCKALQNLVRSILHGDLSVNTIQAELNYDNASIARVRRGLAIAHNILWERWNRVREVISGWSEDDLNRLVRVVRRPHHGVDEEVRDAVSESIRRVSDSQSVSFPRIEDRAKVTDEDARRQVWNYVVSAAINCLKDEMRRVGRNAPSMSGVRDQLQIANQVAFQSICVEELERCQGLMEEFTKERSAPNSKPLTIREAAELVFQWRPRGHLSSSASLRYVSIITAQPTMTASSLDLEDLVDGNFGLNKWFFENCQELEKLIEYVRDGLGCGDEERVIPDRYFNTFIAWLCVLAYRAGSLAMKNHLHKRLWDSWNWPPCDSVQESEGEIPGVTATAEVLTMPTSTVSGHLRGSKEPTRKTTIALIKSYRALCDLNERTPVAQKAVAD